MHCGIALSYLSNFLQATSPQTGGQQTGGSLKSMKDKSAQQEKDVPEEPTLKTAGPGGEITAGLFIVFLKLCGM